MNHKDLISFIEANNLFSSSDKILLAVSGGIDSVVMAYLFRVAGYRFAIAHCNFGLRGYESDGDAVFVKNLAQKFGVPFFLEKFNTEQAAKQKGVSIQMAARNLRYDWFEKVTRENKYNYTATAHHLDDQVETFLINLIRGTGIAGLHGIPVKNDMVVRPLLFASRKDIEEYASESEISWRTDHTNNEAKYLRNKLRHEVIPLMNTINPDFPLGLSETVRRIAAFERIGNAALEQWCINSLQTDGEYEFIDITCFRNLDPAEPYAWMLLSRYGFNETQVSNILSSMYKRTRKIFNSATHILIKERGRLVISGHEVYNQVKPLEIKKFTGEKRIRKPVKLTFKRFSGEGSYQIPALETIASIDYSKLRFPLLIRKWQHGDTFVPLGMSGKKKLSDFFIDQKFSKREKDETWLLCSGDDIIWVIGRRLDHRYRVTPSTTEILTVQYHRQ